MPKTPERLTNIKPHDIPRMAPWLGGNFYYSATQRAKLDREGRERFFMQTIEIPVDILEYTEFIDWDMLKENINLQPMFNDAILVGVGYVHSFK